MNDERKPDTPRDPATAPDPETGVLPDGVRGTTRDVGHTVPADEHAGYKDPNKPELRKPM